MTTLVTKILVPAARERERSFKGAWTSWVSGRGVTLAVPPGPWTEMKRRHAMVGTAFDYLVGAVWAKKPLHPVVERARKACLLRSTTFIDPIFPLLEKVLSVGPVHRDKVGKLRRHRDFYRVLGLLADFDAVYRGGAPVQGGRAAQLNAILQLLGYAALDEMSGKSRIKRVGIYNPRWRLLWVAPIERVAQMLGWKSFQDFRAWFEKMLTGPWSTRAGSSTVASAGIHPQYRST